MRLAVMPAKSPAAAARMALKRQSAPSARNRRGSSTSLVRPKEANLDALAIVLAYVAAEIAKSHALLRPSVMPRGATPRHYGAGEYKRAMLAGAVLLVIYISHAQNRQKAGCIARKRHDATRNVEKCATAPKVTACIFLSPLKCLPGPGQLLAQKAELLRAMHIKLAGRKPAFDDTLCRRRAINWRVVGIEVLRNGNARRSDVGAHNVPYWCRETEAA